MEYIIKQCENALSSFSLQQIVRELCVRRYDGSELYEFRRVTACIKYVDSHITIYARNSLMHNEEGPAYFGEDATGKPFKRYFLFGEELTEEQWEEQLQTKLYW